MKRTLLALFAAGALQLGAQELPVPSPKGTVEQRVGLTDITVEYSRPGVKEREIFGGLVPYGELWRTGANRNTMITFSTPVMINGETVKPGTYSLLTIPNEGEWTIIFNKNTELSGTNNYSEESDVLRTEVPVKESDFTETFTIGIDNIRSESADLVMEWADSKVVIPMRMKVREQALKNIETALKEGGDNKAQVYRNAASYYHNNDMEPETALQYVEKSIEGDKENWYSYWLKAEILADMGKYEAAVESANQAIEVGTESAESEDRKFGYEEMISRSIRSWKEKG